MRILVTIPHAFIERAAPGPNGSHGGDREARAAALLRCVSALHQGFGPGARLVGPRDPMANTDRVSLTVVLVTAQDQNLAEMLPPGVVHHHRTTLHPRMLGFECQGLLRANLGHYDWYCYLEDDLEISDSMFFDKLAWFNASFGGEAVLQPNRYEVGLGPVPKLYIDGEVVGSAATERFQDITQRPRLVAPSMNRSLEFRRVPNPHAGCFFLSAAQMAVMGEYPEFGRYSELYHGPLESAATLTLMRCFDLYKPALANAAFLEVRHLDQRLLGRRVRYTQDGERVLKTVHTEL